MRRSRVDYGETMMRRYALSVLGIAATLCLVASVLVREVGYRNLAHPIGHFLWGMDYELLHRLSCIERGMTESQVRDTVQTAPGAVEMDTDISIWFGEKEGLLLPHVHKAYYYSYGLDGNCYIIFDASGIVSHVFIGGT